MKPLPPFRCLSLVLSVLLLACGPAAEEAAPTGDGSLHQPLTSACVTANDTCRGRLTLAGTWKLPYYRTFALNTANSAITRAVVVVHGNSRDADNYFQHVVNAATTQGVIQQTLIVAPHFQASTTKNDELYWASSDGWKRGDWDSLNKLSSYDVADHILQKLGDATVFPNLRTIVVTGHSAGGQYVQRYAAGSLAQNGLDTSRISVRYAVANPSSYMYLNGNRFQSGVWKIPSTSCTGYDTYKYGLVSRNEYMNRVSSSTIVSQYPARSVFYLLGTLDTATSAQDPLVDGSCAAQLQGNHRYERGQRYFEHVGRYYPAHKHSLVPVAGVGHSGSGMFNSPEGRGVLFP